MAYRENFTLPSEMLEEITSEGFQALPDLIRVVANAAMQAEREQYLKAVLVAIASIWPENADSGRFSVSE